MAMVALISLSPATNGFVPTPSLLIGPSTVGPTFELTTSLPDSCPAHWTGNQHAKQ